MCDVFDLEALRSAVIAFQPEALLHQLTDLPDDAARLSEFGAANTRMRDEGTRNLLAAAGAAGVRRFLAQSIAWQLPPDRQSALEDFEQTVLSAGGVVLRYGQFYGPGTYYEGEAPAPAAHRCRRGRAANGAVARRVERGRRHRRRSVVKSL